VRADARFVPGPVHREHDGDGVETLGLALPGSAMLPAAYVERLALARRAGRRAPRSCATADRCRAIS
jgi:hypothetical protein